MKKSSIEIQDESLQFISIMSQANNIHTLSQSDIFLNEKEVSINHSTILDGFNRSTATVYDENI